MNEEENAIPSMREKRQRSTIGFPYTDYDSVSELAAAIHKNVGHGECSLAQLAAWTHQSVKSSGFRVQQAAAKMFGVIEGGAGAGKVKLTELGRKSVDPNKAHAAKAKAFLNVPLFDELYKKYDGAVTPPNAALETEIVTLGVAEKQKAKARQVFNSSAQQTGFRDAAPDRLVMPATIVHDENEQEQPTNDGGGGGNVLNLDPLIMALLLKIPENLDWPRENRLRWFRTFAMNVSQVYDDDENIVELQIDLVSQNAVEG